MHYRRGQLPLSTLPRAVTGRLVVGVEGAVGRLDVAEADAAAASTGSRGGCTGGVVVAGPVADRRPSHRLPTGGWWRQRGGAHPGDGAPFGGAKLRPMTREEGSRRERVLRAVSSPVPSDRVDPPAAPLTNRILAYKLDLLDNHHNGSVCAQTVNFKGRKWLARTHCPVLMCRLSEHNGKIQ